MNAKGMLWLPWVISSSSIIIGCIIIAVVGSNMDMDMGKKWMILGWGLLIGIGGCMLSRMFQAELHHSVMRWQINQMLNEPAEKTQSSQGHSVPPPIPSKGV